MCSVRGRSFVVAALSGGLLSACEFSDVITIGRDGATAGRAGDGSGGAATNGGGGVGGSENGTSGSGGVQPSIGGRATCSSGEGGGAGERVMVEDGEPPLTSACGLGVQQTPRWVPITLGTLPVQAGVGGSVLPGEYRLRHLMEYGECSCLDRTSSIAQTLVIQDGQGTLISDSAQGGHFAARFAFTTAASAIRITPMCTDPPATAGMSGAFGPFDSYSADGLALVLFSARCKYVAEYELQPIPLD